jgi:hypothetical protein
VQWIIVNVLEYLYYVLLALLRIMFIVIILIEVFKLLVLLQLLSLILGLVVVVGKRSVVFKKYLDFFLVVYLESFVLLK